MGREPGATPGRGPLSRPRSLHLLRQGLPDLRGGLLVQLGYNGPAEPILFVPEWTSAGLSFPTTGTLVARERLEKLVSLKVDEREEPTADRAFLH